MKDGICTKCEAKEVHVYHDTTVELFVENKGDLSKIAEKYPKVY